MLPRVTRKIKQALIRRKAKKNGILTRNLLIIRYLLSRCATTTTQPTLTERNFRKWNNLLTEAHDKKSNNFFPKCVNIKLRFAFSNFQILWKFPQGALWLDDTLLIIFAKFCKKQTKINFFGENSKKIIFGNILTSLPKIIFFAENDSSETLFKILPKSCLSVYLFFFRFFCQLIWKLWLP